MKYSRRYFDLEKLVVFVLCALAVTALGAVLFGCDSGDVINEIIECQLPPGHCQMDDDKFDEMFNALTLNEQTAYVEDWGQPTDQREGFVSQ